MAETEFYIATDNTEKILAEVEAAAARALEKIGNQCQNYAADTVRTNTSGTGRLAGSINHVVDGNSVIVGTNVEYAPYVEYGTGMYGPNGGTGGGWWVYVEGGGSGGGNSGKRYSYDEAIRVLAILKSKGLNAHMTQGRKALHFMRNAVDDHKDEYINIIEQEFGK